ncbi:lysine--tRNA ligase [Patescibacteria group bacterium]|nr:lysine--tRNA ligase [Patescibacteria group bacterium]
MARNVKEQPTGNQFEHRKNVRQKLIDEGVNVYPQDGHKTHTNAEALALPEGSEVQIAGRIMSLRGHGKIFFIDVHDQTGRAQVVIKVDETENPDFINYFGKGDFIRVNGTRYVTQRGEQSVLAKNFEMLSKALKEIPRKLTNKETRLRLRSVDMLANPEVRSNFEKASLIQTSVRHTLEDYGFYEVETPVMQPQYGGANARPFTTYINAWGIPLYLRISPELYLKYFLMGGTERVYEIAKNFRNEGVDKTHNPEFTMMECYSAFWDYTDMMALTEVIYRNACVKIHGKAECTFRGHVIDFSQPWRRLPMKQGILEYLGLDVDQMSDAEIQAAIVEHGEEYKGEWIRGLGIAKLFGAVEQYLVQPTFVTDMPKETTSLCKPHRDDPSLIERFEPYICGIEIGNAYTELNDPVLQEQFWLAERKDDEEAHPIDETFLESMRYGMPPAGGLGLGMNRMKMIILDLDSITDEIAFPTMKPVVNAAELDAEAEDREAAAE